MDALLDCVVTKESLLTAAEQTLWSGSDALKLSIPTGEDTYSNEQIPNDRKINSLIFTSDVKNWEPLGKINSHFKG